MTNANEFFLGRQTILDRDQNLAGFELLFRSGHKNMADFLDEDTATSLVINHSFNELGFKTVLGKHRGYINVSKSVLISDMIELLPKEQVVLELLESIQVDAEVIERCKHLKSIGYMLALDDLTHYSSHLEQLKDVIDVVKVDIDHAGHERLGEIIGNFKNWPARMLAEKVDNHETAGFCHNLGFDLFQGYYYSKPIIITGKRLTHSNLELLRLIGLLNKDADTAMIEGVFKRNPGLAFNLLRLANTAASGAHSKIASVNHAIMELGRRQIKRWLQILLFASDLDFPLPNPLFQLAATRGKFMELLAVEVNGSNHEIEDQAYMVGIMSLMDTLLGMPLSEIISPINPPNEVRNALLSRSGQLGILLQLIEMLEKNDMVAAARLVDSLAPLEIGRVNMAQIKALAWANSIDMEK